MCCFSYTNVMEGHMGTRKGTREKGEKALLFGGGGGGNFGRKKVLPPLAHAHTQLHREHLKSP